MNGNIKVFGIIKFCLVLAIIVCAVGLSYFDAGDNRNNQNSELLSDGSTYDITTSYDDLYQPEFINQIQVDISTLPDSFSVGKKIEERELVFEIIDEMTVEEKVGQLFFLCVKTRFDASILDEYKIGGILLFGNDVAGENRESLKRKVDSFQEKSEIPLLVGIDEEGGQVSRLNTNSLLVDNYFQSPRDIYNAGGLDAVELDTEKKCELLKSYGINVNFAPVCDISTNPSEYMYSRSLGQSVDITSEYVADVVSVMNENKTGCVLKHFPGYGPNGDTHTGIVHDNRSYEELENNDFKPFIAGIENGAGCILVSHNIVECIDSELPASISPKMHKIIRENLGFDGVIITDDLSMGGVLQYMDNNEAAVQSIIAGNDMIIATYYQEQYQAVLNAAKDGTISEERLDDAVFHVLMWKKNLGLLQD